MTENRSGSGAGSANLEAEENSRFPKIRGRRLPNPRAGQDNRLRLRARPGRRPVNQQPSPDRPRAGRDSRLRLGGPPRTTPGQFRPKPEARSPKPEAKK